MKLQKRPSRHIEYTPKEQSHSSHYEACRNVIYEDLFDLNFESAGLCKKIGARKIQED